MTLLALTDEEVEAVVEKLEEEHDLLCLGRPSAERIAEALEWAADAKIADWWRRRPGPRGTLVSRKV